MKISKLIQELEEIKKVHGDLDLIQFRNDDSTNIVDPYSYGPDIVGVNIDDTSWGGKETRVVTYDLETTYEELRVLMN